MVCQYFTQTSGCTIASLLYSIYIGQSLIYSVTLDYRSSHNDGDSVILTRYIVFVYSGYGPILHHAVMPTSGAYVPDQGDIRPSISNMLIGPRYEL